MAPSGMPLPGVVVLSSMNVSAVATGAPIDFVFPPDPSALRFLTWLYADGDVDAKTAGASDPVVTVNVHLKQGWNRVSWQRTFDSTGTLIGLSLADASDVDEVYVNYPFTP